MFARKAKVPSGDFIAPEQVERPNKGRAPVYAIATDPSGRLRWESNELRGDRLVVLTSRKASTGYLADLRAKSISYLLCGPSRIDFATALARLRSHFGIRRVMLEGGGSINGALLAAGLIDEISLLICPFADGAPDLPTVFDAPKQDERKKATALRLMAAKPRPGGIVWLRYRVQ